MRIDLVGHERFGRAQFDQLHIGFATGEACDAALALARDGVALGRIEIAERDLAVEPGFHGSDFRHHAGGVLGIRCLRYEFTPLDALPENVRVVEALPHTLARSGNRLFATEFHAPSLFDSKVSPRRQRALVSA